MKTDVQIANETKLKYIRYVAEDVGIPSDYHIYYGKVMSKIDLSFMDQLRDKKDGKLILVTSVNPTPAGEGKTTVSIGLSMALDKIGKNAMGCLREPSLGPSFGIKGGAAGGGYSQVAPMTDINLHFTGDFHAITSAHNLIAAMIDNHLQHGNELGIDPRRVVWKRVVDMNDRALRDIVIGLGGMSNGVTRESGYDITVASELMAILCLSKDIHDLKERVSKIVVAYTYDGEPVYVKDINAQGSVTVLLKDAINPNIVQTLENTPVLIHGGPFANIAHGCNSIIATKMALKLSDYVVTEAGFGADLGAEKFFNITCRYGNFKPDAVVIVATIKALKYHGGVEADQLGQKDMRALIAGFDNLGKHIENIKKFGIEPVVAINRFTSDTDDEINLLEELCKSYNVEVVTTTCWADGGDGAADLAEKVVDICDKSDDMDFEFLYDIDDSIEEKLNKIATEIYGANGVDILPNIRRQIKEYERLGFDKYPVCMAKTESSLSDDPKKLGRPKDFDILISELRISNGAGFIVALTGDVMTMPGLPKVPTAESIDIDENGDVIGLF